MLSDTFTERMSEDWLWRERELRQVDARLLKQKEVVDLKAGILIAYSHWEGHFKFNALALLEFITEGIKRKIFKWTDIKTEVRQRILFCSYRRSSLSGQNQETFVSYLNALNDSRYADALKAKDEIVMVDDNLNTLRAEAICRNLGIEYDWCILKKIVIDERLVEHRNAIAHGSRRLRSGDEIDFLDPSIGQLVDEARSLIRETNNRFQNALAQRHFLA